MVFRPVSSPIFTDVFSFQYLQCYYHHKYLLLLDIIVWCRNISIVIALWNKIAKKISWIEFNIFVYGIPTKANYIKTIDPKHIALYFYLILPSIFVVFFLHIFLFRISIVVFAAGSQTMFTDLSVFVTFSNSHKHYTLIQVKLTKRTQTQCLNECKEFFYKWYLGRTDCIFFHVRK